jgi:hypothetical protein
MSMAVPAFADDLAARHAERGDQSGHHPDFNRASLSRRVPISSGRLGWVRPKPTQPAPCRSHRRGGRCWRPSRNIALQFERPRQMRLQPTRFPEAHRAWRGVCGLRYRTQAPMRRRRQSVMQRHGNDLGDQSGGKRLLSVGPRRVLGEVPSTFVARAPLASGAPSEGSCRLRRNPQARPFLRPPAQFLPIFGGDFDVFDLAHAKQIARRARFGDLCQKRKG